VLRWSRRIFISYRRAEAGDLVGRLHDWLVNRTRHSVFLDVDMAVGTPFPEAIAKELRDCEALLAIIGPGWLDASDAQGRRRLDDPQDFVRVEIETALQRGVLVVPVLVNGAAMPAEADLPAPLAGLTRRHALPLRSETFHFDVGRLLAAWRIPPHLRVLAAVAGILLLAAAASIAGTVGTMTGNVLLAISDAAAAAALAALGIWLLLDQWRRPFAAGVLLGVGPFVLLKIWRSAVLRGVPLWESTVVILSVSAAAALVILLLAIDPAAGLRYERPRGEVTRTVVPLGAVACVALAAVGSSLPTSAADLGTLRLSDPLVLLSAAILALLVTSSRGTLRGSILAGWAAGATAVLVNTIWLRSYSGFALPPVMDAHLLLSVLTVAVLVAVAVLALREKPRTAVR
jgi:hypothetical protein